MSDLLQVLLGGVGVAAVVFFVGRLLRDSLKMWIDNATRYALDTRLERTKAELQQQAARALEQLRVENEQRLRTDAAIIASATAGQTGAFSRRLAAIQNLWIAMLRLRDKKPIAIGMTEWMTDVELLDYLRRPDYEAIEKGLEPGLTEVLAGAIRAERYRLLAGEYLWSLCFSYRFLVGRVGGIIRMRLDGHYPREQDWRTDAAILTVAGQFLNSEQLSHFKGRQIGGLTDLLGIIESRFVAAAYPLLSGEQTANEMAETTRRLQEAVRKAQASVASSENNDK